VRGEDGAVPTFDIGLKQGATEAQWALLRNQAMLLPDGYTGPTDASDDPRPPREPGWVQWDGNSLMAVLVRIAAETGISPNLIEVRERSAN
jgi:hypothetical protein